MQQHLAAIQEANKLQEDAHAALVSLSLRCEGLAETTAAESAGRQVGRRCRACDHSRWCAAVRRATLSPRCQMPGSDSGGGGEDMEGVSMSQTDVARNGLVAISRQQRVHGHHSECWPQGAAAQ